MPNELSVLRCWHCGGVPSKTKDEIKNLIKDENLMVTKDNNKKRLVDKFFEYQIREFDKVKSVSASYDT